MNFYKTDKWKKKRAAVLRRDKYQCRECVRYGKTTQAKVVHHTFPLEFYPEHKLNSDTLISLCGSCHERMHVKGSHELTAEGIRWMEKTRTMLPRPT